LARAPSSAGRLLAFRLGEERFGMDATAVREVRPPLRLSRVPHAPDALLGVAGLRGEVVPILSLARLMGREETGSERIILADLDGPVGLAVTAVSQMVTASEAKGIPLLDIAALIARAMPERRARVKTARTASMHDVGEDRAQNIAMIAFAAGGQDFALPVTAVEDVLRLPATIARLPHADAATIGSIAWRDSLLPLLLLSGLLGMAAAPITPRTSILVIRIGSHRLGLVVDAMGRVERVAEGAIDTVPQLLNRGGEAHIQAICRLDGGRRLLSVLATDRLVSQEMTARLLPDDRGATETMDDFCTQDDLQTFLLFRIGDEQFGLPIEAVQEVMALPSQLTRLPRAPSFVKGVMQVRGEVIPVIDQASRFNGQPATAARPRVIVLRMGELTVGFIVDAVREVARLPASALREAPDLGVEGMRVFDRMASLDGQEALVLIVSPRELLDRAERDLLIELGKKGAKSRT
jgi:purine-binding chemotaxis protein CheW